MAVRRSRLYRAVALTLLVTAAIASAPANAAPLDPTVPNSAAKATQFIVKFKDKSNGRLATQSLDKAVEGASTDVGLAVERPMSFGADVVTAGHALGDADVSAVLQNLNDDPNVEYAELNSVFTASEVPNDPRFPDQWHLQDTPVGIEMPKAWDIATGKGVTVADVDSGRLNHPDLTPAYVGGFDFISTPPGPGNPNPSCEGDGRDSDPTDACNYGHGLRTAGTIAATTNNNAGIAGVAFGARVVPVRVLDANGATLGDVVDGLNWAVGGTVPGVPPNPNPAKVVNMSLDAALPCPQSLQLVLDAAAEAGATVVVSVGNNGQDVSTEAPGNCTGDFLRVAASDRSGALASYSNFGPLVDITAPGGRLTPNAEDGILTTDVGATYAYAEGTSYSAPQVAGVAALILEVAPKLTPVQVVSIIKRTAKPLPVPCAVGCGAGLLDAHAAVQAARPRLGGFGSTGS